MRPVLQKKKKNYKLLVIYILIAIICIVGLGMALYMQYFQDEKIDREKLEGDHMYFIDL